MFNDVDEKLTVRSVVDLEGYGCISLECDEGSNHIELTVDNHDHGIVTVDLNKRDLFSLMGRLMEAQGWLK